MSCHLCLCYDEEVFPIFEKESESMKLIVNHLQLEFTDEPNSSTKVCSQCIVHLKEIDEFFEYIKERQQMFKNEKIFDQTTIEIVNINDMINEENLSITEEEELVMPEEIKIDEDSNPVSVEFVSPDNVATNDECSQNESVDLELPKKFNNIKTYKNRAEGSREKDEFIEQNAQLKCEICRYISKTFRDFNKHFQEKHKRSPYIKCCGLRLYTKNQMHKHIVNHVDPDRYKCKFCGKILSSQFNLQAHIGSFHTEKEKLQHACNLCDERFSSAFVLKNHLNVHNEDKNYSCEICNKTFKHARSVQRHLRLEHGNGGLHVCELCGKSYKYKQVFEQHMADKHNIISRETMKFCTECKCWFSTKYYNKHAEHHKIQDIECTRCNKIFPSKAALIKHRDIHYHAKKCGICGLRFEKQREFKEHVKTHAS